MGSELAIDIGTSPYLRPEGVARSVQSISYAIDDAPTFFMSIDNDSSHINHPTTMDDLLLKNLLFAPVDLIFSLPFLFYGCE